MDAFGAQQQDEGYSEDPLNPPASASSLKHGFSVLASQRPAAEFPEWLMRHITGLSIQEKTDLAMALLSDLPTGLIAQVVQQLNPRLYIDFIRYLPPEICLKILGYLDPVSLIHVAQACRTWYELAIDRKLWEKAYYLEGWKAKNAEIEHWEAKANEDSSSSSIRRPLRTSTSGSGRTHRKRAAPTSPELDADLDMVMSDIGGAFKQEPAEMEMGETSIFGGAAEVAPKTGMTQHLGELDMNGYSSSAQRKGKGVDKGKAKADPAPEIDHNEYLLGVPKSTLWMWDVADGKYKVNWKYLYTMRRRLESNWELGKFTNFQLPHPDFPEEGHGECIYSLQYNSQYLVSGSRDRTLRVWNIHTRRLVRPPLAAHHGSVLCLQFDSDPDEDLIVSGSSDSSVILWRFSTGEVIQRLRQAHRESVLNVKFDKRILVTCSKDKTIKIFNRRPLRFGDLGYQGVDPVPRNVKNYAYELPMDQLPVIPPYTMIGSLEGHGAAVNAVQIHDREVVSASGDRHIKVWDWPSQVCTRTFVGHSKGIACVQYDGRRIVSGSSDNEVKVFDRHTGLEVASLRSHSNLVRTVQAGFGDLPYSVDEDAAEARRVDAEYFKALEAGQLDDLVRGRHARRQGNAGSTRPEDIAAYGAKLPPGGGGGKYGRIVSGSYDTSIIIWRRDKEGIWKDQHRLKQEEAAAAALRQGRTPQPANATATATLTTTAAGPIPLHPSMLAPVRQPVGPPTSTAAGQSSAGPALAAAAAAGPSTASGRPATPPNQPGFSITQVESPIFATLTPSSIASYRQMIDIAVPQGPQALAQALASYPTMLTQRGHLQAAIDREASPFVKSQLRQAVNTALFRTQFEQARQRRDAVRNLERQQQQTAAGQALADRDGGQASSSADQAQIQQATATATAGSSNTNTGQDTNATAAAQPTTASQAMFHAPGAGVHLHQLQFDARRIICCSQTSVIVGWDFCNGDPELEEASRFFAAVQ
ncbi:WD40 repeat-like protein [Phialemonium atrogriseum]|uniref:WD40 repeat-like protein n=1 Tax=Phialemonium atrogriseum TaxID=1093897 RepID=A0AAJ0BQQ0_9PEZI|nr:WD40 repeat-like protein [Phialemonium atrogriseum]KAK1761658.1 WD40 repeat-like protein [Phialemonium atrogriseum]